MVARGSRRDNALEPSLICLGVQVASRSCPACTFKQIALPDAFLDAGALPTLHERYGISAGAMTARIKAWL